MTQLQKDSLLGLFIIIMKGIRDEYENGASNRSMEKDINTLKEYLEKID